MTCQELNLHLDNYVRKESTAESDGDAITAHLSTCSDCRRLFEERNELERSLQLVRDSAPRSSEELDARVLANYRRLVSEPAVAPKTILSRPAILAWTAFAAALLLGAALIMMRPKNTVTILTQNPVPQTIATSPATSEPVRSTTSQSKPSIHARHFPKPRHQSASPDPALASAQVVRSLPEGFRSLMYCDELSCAQDMDMIRVQLPSAFVMRSGRSLPQPGGLVNADVLVGPDGIARGIRFEQ